MTMPGYRDRQKAEIIRTAREILRAEGLEGLQARRVAAASGCSVGTIYNLFGNLDMVTISANAETLAELHAELVADEFPDRDVAARLDAMAMTYLRFAVERTSEWRALFQHRFATDVAVPEWYRQSQSDLFALVEEIFANVIDDRARRAEAARAMFAAVHGVISMALDQKLGDFDEAMTRRQVEFITSAISHGMSGVLDQPSGASNV